MTNIVDKKDGCIFCKIAVDQKDSKGVPLVTRNDEFFIINDIRPHAPTHYLVISDKHIPTWHDLSKDDADFLDRMEKLGREKLEEKLGHKIDENQLRIGFHQPPLLSVSHLHLHLCYPYDEMDFISRWLLFRRGRFFKNIDDIKSQL